MQMNVIVGQEYASTPVFTDTLEYIVFSPDWTVPTYYCSKRDIAYSAEESGLSAKTGYVSV
jgi:murein L,D-transpeptidase YcbB/YkuD